MNKRLRIIQSTKQIEKKKKRIIIINLLLIFCIILFLISTILFLRLPFIQISNIKIINSSIDSKEILNEIDKILINDYFNIIPKSNIFFYPKSEIKNKLIYKFKKINNLKIKTNYFDSIEIDIEDRQPTAILCNGFNDEDNESKECFYIDKDAMIFDKSPNFSSGVYPIYYFILNNDNNLIGSHFIDHELFIQLQSMINILKKEKINVCGILLNESGEYELYIKNRDMTDAIVYFNNRMSYEKIATNLISFLNSTKDNFEYINLRFGNNIFYVTK